MARAHNILKECTEVSSFVGRMHHIASGELKLCDGCKKAPATWVHELKKTNQKIYLCFGCGDH